MIILAIETAYDICGAAVLKEGELSALEEIHAPRQHNERLAAQVEAAMAKSKLQFADLDALAVSCGPGSYTGLRIGMSYAKGIAMGANLPIIPVPTLAAMAHSLDEQIDWVAAWSHRELFYASELTSDRTAEAISLSLIDLQRLAVDHKISVYIPDGANIAFDGDLLPICPSTENVGKFAHDHRDTAVSTVDRLVPNYIKNYQVNVT